MKLKYTSRARDDVELAFVWYERQRRGLGFEFLDCIDTAIKLILENPEMYQVYYSNMRGCVVRKFPVSIYYTIERNEIIIHAVFANRQDPDKLP